MLKKRCSKCGISKDASEFYKNKSARDGLDHYCRGCNNKRMKIYFNTPKGKAAYRRMIEKMLEKQRLKMKNAK